MADGRPFTFAGLWERWEGGPDGAVAPCALLTTGPNDLLAPIYDRMPAILSPADYVPWPDREVRDPEALLPLLRPYPPQAPPSVPESSKDSW